MNKYLLWGSISLIGMIGPMSMAVAQNIDPQSDTYQQNEQDALYRDININPMDVIHNSNLSQSRNLEQFTQDTSQNINDAAAEYKRLQQQRLEQSTIDNQQ